MAATTVRPAWWSRLAADHLLDAVADLGVDVARVLEGKRRRMTRVG
jgi:hypothetical protein